MDNETKEQDTGDNGRAIPPSFRLLSAGALVWNLLGVMAYVSQVTMSDAALLALPENERILYTSIPAWATSAFAIAVNGGALGCILLLMRKSWAFPILVLSLLGVLVQMTHSIFFTNSMEVYGPGGMIMPTMVLVVSIYLVWYSNHARTNGWIT